MKWTRYESYGKDTPSPVVSRRLLWAILLAALAMRLYVAYFHVGSTDVKRWLIFSEIVAQGDFRELYFSRGPLWNHPAPIILLLYLTMFLKEALGLPFHFALKLLPALADVGVTIMVFLMAKERTGTKMALALSASYALSPAAILISGYHGNTDCIMVLFVLLAVWCFERRPVASGLFLGASLSVKYTTLLLVPVFVMYCPGLGAMLRYGALSLAPIVLLSIPFVRAFPAQAVQNIVTYSSEPRAWGLGHWRAVLEMELLGEMGTSIAISVVERLLAWSKVLIVTTVLLLAVANRFLRNLTILEASGLAMGVFFLLTPGFGVQYAVWLLALFLLVEPGWGTVFNLSISHFVANAFYEGRYNDMGQLNPDVHVTLFSLLAWISVLFLVVRGFRKLFSFGASSEPKPG